MITVLVPVVEHKFERTLRDVVIELDGPGDKDDPDITDAEVVVEYD
jgi:hypothetical protein